MKRIEIADTAASAANYQLADGRIFRIHLKLLTPVERLAEADTIEVETQGFEVTKSGAFVVDDKTGIPNSLAPQRARIPMTHVRAGSDSMKPGWIEQPLPEDKAARKEELARHKSLKNLPKTATAGDIVASGDKLYTYTDGLYESVRTGRLADLAKVAPAPVKLDEAAIANLIP